MSKHKETYFKFYGLSEGDYIQCGVCQQPAVDVHAIQRAGMGGDENMNRVENLIPLCRQHHEKLGDRKEYKAMLYKIIFHDLIRKDIDDVDLEWLGNQIKKYE